MIAVWRELLRRIIPEEIRIFFSPTYHFLLALVSAMYYGFPSRKLTIIGVTGTNGKSTVVEMLRRILEADGKRVASISSLRFQRGDREWKNELKMTMPGRFFLQQFIREAAKDRVSHLIIEVTSEGIRQFRHRFIQFQVAVLTNITPEHIESHGSFENYRDAKISLFKEADIHILNGDDPSIELLSSLPAKQKLIYRLKDFPQDLSLPLPGEFNKANALAAVYAARALGVSNEVSFRALSNMQGVPGRFEEVIHSPRIIVDYAHTPDALRKVYETAKNTGTASLICVLGAAGGGRDKWKRSELGRIADELCSEVFITNEDPYDEDPEKIMNDVLVGVTKHVARKILDRREAIREAIKKATANDTILISGKGAEPWLMEAKGKKIPWDDREIVREEFAKVFPR